MAYSSRKLATHGAIGVLFAIMIIASMQTQFSYGAGTLSILVTDPPDWGDITHVYINISAIEIHSNSSGWILLPMPEGVDYLELNLTDILDTETDLLQSPLNPGKYNELRFEILNATVTVNGTNRTAIVPSGKIKIKITQGGVTIQSNQESKLLLDIESRVVYSKGKDEYKIVPAAKAIPLQG